MKLADMSINTSGIIKATLDQLAISLHYGQPTKREKFYQFIEKIKQTGLLKYEHDCFIVPMIRERVGTPEDIQLNSKSITADEKKQALINEVLLELSFVGYCEVDDPKYAQPILTLSKRYPEHDILRATKQFANDYAAEKINHTEIQDPVKYYFVSIANLLKPSSEFKNDESIFQESYIGILNDAGYATQENLPHLLQIYEDFKKAGKDPSDIVGATKMYVEDTSLNNTEVKNRAAHLRATLKKILNTEKFSK